MAGHGLESYTKEISVIKLEYLGVNLCFVDTPGFDNTCKSDVDILKLIENGLSTTYVTNKCFGVMDYINDLRMNGYRKQFRLAGLLYLHRISDNRVAGSSLKYFRLFQQLCGDDFSNIVLTTTMWGEDEQVRAAHEEELMSDFWRPMIACGSSVKRFLYTRESAFEILSPFFAEVQRRSVRHLRNNLQHCRLLQNSPSAAEASQVKLRELVLLHENILGRIQGEPGETSDPHQLRLLMNDYRTASVRLQRAAKFSKGNRIPVRLSRLVFISCIPLLKN